MNNMEVRIITTAIIRNGSKYLIAKRAKTKRFAPNQWEFISGFIDAPETAEEAILREIKEELGIEGKIIDRSNQFDIVDDEGSWTVIPFLVELSTPDIQVHPEDHSEARWVIADEFNTYPDLKPFLDNEGIQKLLKN